MCRLISIVLTVATLISQVNADDWQPDCFTTSIGIHLERDMHFNSTVSSGTGNSSGSSESHASQPGSNRTLDHGNNATLEQGMDETQSWQDELNVTAIYIFGLPVVVVLATVGNTFSIITLQHPTFRKSSTSFILSALALVDLVYVDFSATQQWFQTVNVVMDITLTSFGCKFTAFMLFFPRMVSRSLCHTH